MSFCHYLRISAPYFALVETRSGHKTTESYYSAHGAFTPSTRDVESLHGRHAFTVYINYSTSDMFVEIRSRYLKRAIREALRTAGVDIPASLGESDIENTWGFGFEPEMSYIPGFLDHKVMFRSYQALRSYLKALKAPRYTVFGRDISGTAELKLLVNNLLSDSKLLESFGLEQLYKEGILCGAHWADLKKQSLSRDLDDLEECYSLGQEGMHEASNASTINALTINNLKTAIRNGSEDTVRKLLASLGTVPSFCLADSLEYGQSRIFALLLSHGAAVNSVGSNGTTPLYVAINKGNLPAIYMLLSRGADVNGNNSGCPVAAAASQGFLNVVHCLLQNGADIHGTAKESPLRNAAIYGQSDIMKILLEKGANEQDLHGQYFPMEKKYPAGRERRFGDFSRHSLLFAGFESSFDPLRDCPVSIALQERERRRELGVRLRGALAKITKLVYEASLNPSATPGFKKLALQLRSHDKTWGSGMRTIRRLFKNRLPENLEQVISFMKVAEAMRSSKNSEDSSEPPEDPQAFLASQDIHMWRSVVSLEDQVVFDEAIGAIWPKHEFSDHDSQLDDPPSTPKLLQYFQGLAQNLISDATGSLSPASPLSHGTESGGGAPSLGFERPLIYSFHQEQLDPIEHTMPPIYLASSTNVSTEVLRLISTAFVGLVIAFLLALKSPATSLKIQDLLITHTQGLQGRDYNLAYNCVLLALYLGLSSITIPRDQGPMRGRGSSPGDEGFDSQEDSQPPATLFNLEDFFDFDLLAGVEENALYPPNSLSTDVMLNDSMNFATPLDFPSASTPAGFGSPNFNNASRGIALRSSSSLDRESAEPPPTRNDLTCPRCPEKRFVNISNRNRHVTKDCPLLSLTGRQCPNSGCGRIMKRPDNMARHVKKCTARRMRAL